MKLKLKTQPYVPKHGDVVKLFWSDKLWLIVKIYSGLQLINGTNRELLAKVSLSAPDPGIVYIVSAHDNMELVGHLQDAEL